MTKTIIEILHEITKHESEEDCAKIINAINEFSQFLNNQDEVAQGALIKLILRCSNHFITRK